jgi:RNA polymerase sigma factor (TIGR02999 family)
MDTDTPITDLLDAWAEGDHAALDALMAVVYTELQASAKRALGKERRDHTLEPTALVNEVYLRLLRLKKVSWEGRGTFFAFAARLMRNILVEHARALGARKRGGHERRITLTRANLIVQAPTIDLLVLDEALSRLEKVDPSLVKLIELRFFAGLTEDETAEVLRSNRTAVQREWAVGKRLLVKLLEEGSP